MNLVHLYIQLTTHLLNFFHILTNQKKVIAYQPKLNGNFLLVVEKKLNLIGITHTLEFIRMMKNSMRYSWTAEEVDEKLHMIMHNIFKNSLDAAHEYGLGDDLVAGANIAGFLKVARAMMAYGVC